MVKEYVTLAGDHIKRSNIKTFGVSIEKERISQANGVKLFRGLRSILQGGNFLDGFNQQKLKEGRRYLYVTTFQNDNHQYFDDEIDIEKALQDIEDSRK